jgi:hypothetical protein
MRELHIGDAPLHHVGSDVDVGVVAAADQLAGSFRGKRMAVLV